jgi:uncharacterized protein with HEPN domain
MQANNRDAGSLWDMVQAIHRIQEFTANLSYEALESDHEACKYLLFTKVKLQYFWV